MIDVDRKLFVLDTNVLLHNPGALFAFTDNHVVIPMTVLEELDKFKSNNNELGRNSREVARSLDRLRDHGGLREGVPTPGGGILQVVLRYDQLTEMLPGVNDNRIIGCAHILQREGCRVTFVSKDINARIKADALGIHSEDFENRKIDYHTLYTGWREVAVSDSVIHNTREAGKLELSDDQLAGGGPFGWNEFALLRTADGNSVLTRYDRDQHALMVLSTERSSPYGIKARNVEQRMAIDLLMDDNVRLVTLVGAAGTGKTLLALAAGMERVLRDHQFNKLAASRPIMPLGKDIGYLPGSKDDKIQHWMGPIFDNLYFILDQLERDPDEMIKRLLRDDTITMEALTYIRGRSISKNFVIIDEAQNLTPHEVKTIISRAGNGTKIILTGDPEQIDNPYLDANSNGLTYLVERLRNKRLAGHMRLSRSERSELAALAIEVL